MADQPTEIVELSDDLTSPQLKKLQAPAEAELKDLLDNGDRTPANAARVTELRGFIGDIKDRVLLIEGTEWAPVPDPAPAAVDPEEAPAEEAPAEEGEGNEEAAPESAEPAEEPAPAADEQSDVDAQAKAILDAAMADADFMAKFEQGTGPIEADEILEPEGSTVGGAPIFAALGAGADVISAGRTDLEAVGAQIKGAIPVWKAMSPTQSIPLFRVDKTNGRGLNDELTLGDNAAHNNEILFGGRRDDAIQAATDLSYCGDPVKITVAGCPFDSSTPFLDALADNSISARNCQVEWDLPISWEDINPGPQLWTSNCDPSDQSQVDPADQSTWKPVSMELPPCPDKCYAEPFDTVAGLKVTMNDEICRPEKIDQANRIIECMHAVLLEQTAMALFDRQVGASHHFNFDTSATTLGAMPSLVYALRALTSTFGLERKHPVTGQGLTAFVHPSILATLEMDMYLAGEQGGNAQAALADAFRSAGINRVVYTKDFGICEGNLCGSLDGNATLCDTTNCSITNLAADCVPFGGGNDLPALADSARIRIADTSSWWHGSEFLVDYALRKDGADLRQNVGYYFGERRDLLFQASACSTFQAVLDVQGMCATGQRVDHQGTVPCPMPGTAKIAG